MDRLRGFATWFFTPVADRLLRWKVSPDAVTITGTVIVVLAAMTLLPTGHLLAASLIITVFVLTDSLDGVMARRAGRSGSWGAFLDSTLDRFADAAIFTGLTLWFVGRDDAVGDWGMGLALACLVLGSIVPYARARAEGLGMTAKVGIAERADRLVAVLVAIFLVGVGLPAIVLVVVLGLLAVASLITVVQRMATVRRQATALPDGAAQ